MNEGSLVMSSERKGPTGVLGHIKDFSVYERNRKNFLRVFKLNSGMIFTMKKSLFYHSD